MAEHTIGRYKIRTFELAPKGFDPFKATAAQLLHHGFPRRPDPATEPDASLTWVRLMGKYRDLKVTHVLPQFKELPTHIHGPNKRRNEASRGLVNGTSSNWSGSVLFIDPNVDPFTWIFGQWTVPNAYSPNPGDGNTYYSSAWIGIDGDGSPDVLQAGTETDVTGSGPATSYAWMEWFPDFSVGIANFPFAPGDAATLLICSTGPNTAWFSFGNLTSLQYTSFTLTAPQGTTLVGNCAEVVLERPGVNGALAELPRYGENFFDAATAYTKSGATYDLGTGATISMVADDGVTIISTPEVVDSDAVRMYYTGP
jgi:peptidase A4-like protein